MSVSFKIAHFATVHVAHMGVEVSQPKVSTWNFFENLLHNGHIHMGTVQALGFISNFQQEVAANGQKPRYLQVYL